MHILNLVQIGFTFCIGVSQLMYPTGESGARVRTCLYSAMASSFFFLVWNRYFLKRGGLMHPLGLTLLFYCILPELYQFHPLSGKVLLNHNEETKSQVVFQRSFKLQKGLIKVFYL